MTLRKCKVWRKPSVSEQWCVNTRLEVIYFFVNYTYIKCILVSEIVVWLGSRRINFPKMENAENLLKIDVIKPINLPFIQEKMTLWWISDETARRTGNNAKMGFLTEDSNRR